jgi:hypothetical protein
MLPTSVKSGPFSRGGFTLGFGKGGYRKRLILALKLSTLSLFHDLVLFCEVLDLDLFGGERNPQI